jgi:hypothetical protein
MERNDQEENNILGRIFVQGEWGCKNCQNLWDGGDPEVNF